VFNLAWQTGIGPKHGQLGSGCLFVIVRGHIDVASALLACHSTNLDWQAMQALASGKGLRHDAMSKIVVDQDGH